MNGRCIRLAVIISVTLLVASVAAAWQCDTVRFKNKFFRAVEYEIREADGYNAETSTFIDSGVLKPNESFQVDCEGRAGFYIRTRVQGDDNWNSWRGTGAVCQRCVRGGATEAEINL